MYYLQGAIKNVDNIFSKDHGACLKKYGKVKSPYPQYYRPKLDITNELDAYGISRYHKFIGTPIWSIELGHIDIIMEVSCISQKNCSPQEVHQDAVYWMFR